MSLPWNAFFHNGDSPKNAQRTVSVVETVLCEPALDGLLIEVGREGIEPSRTHRPGDFKSEEVVNRLAALFYIVLQCYRNEVSFHASQRGH